MDNHNEDTLMKSRSYRACIAAGYKLYNACFRTLLKASLLTTLLYGIVSGLLGTLLVLKLPALALRIMASPTYLPLTVRQYLLTLGGIVLLWLLSGVVEMVAYARVCNKLSEHQQTGTMMVGGSWLRPDWTLTWRTLKGLLATGLTVAVGVVLIGVAAWLLPQGSAVADGLLCVLCVAVLLLLLPMSFVALRYILNDKLRFWGSLRQSYALALRHYGLVAAVLFVSLLVLAIVSFVTTLPALIIAVANSQSQVGALMGDPLGMPSYVVWLTAATFLLAGLIQIYTRMTLFFTTYYMYGSITTQEEERRLANLPT